jgi:hypothetical protein
VLILRMLLGAFRPPKPENRICCGKAQYGCQPIERRKAEDKLPAAQPTEIEGLSLGPDCLRAAGQGQSFEAACSPIINRPRRKFEYPHREHSAAHRPEPIDRRWRG